jgi:GTPase
VRKLPHGLVEAFKSTLEESTRADLLLHVVDVSRHDAGEQIAAVREVLEEIGADRVPEQLVLNKVDIADAAEVRRVVRELRREGVDPVAVSAVSGAGIEGLVERVALRLPDRRIQVEVTVPFDRSELVNLAHRHGEVHKQAYSEHGTELVATVDLPVARAMRDLLDPDPFADEPERFDR